MGTNDANPVGGFFLFPGSFVFSGGGTLVRQTALNLAMDLFHAGVLEQFDVEMIGAQPEAIAKAEEREQFKTAMDRIKLDVCRGKTVTNLEDARGWLKEIGLPAVVRPSFTLGGSGSSIAYNRNEYNELVRRGLDQSPVTEVLIEESIIGHQTRGKPGRHGLNRSRLNREDRRVFVRQVFCSQHRPVPRH